MTCSEGGLREGWTSDAYGRLCTTVEPGWMEELDAQHAVGLPAGRWHRVSAIWCVQDDLPAADRGYAGLHVARSCPGPIFTPDSVGVSRLVPTSRDFPMFAALLLGSGRQFYHAAILYDIYRAQYTHNRSQGDCAETRGST